MDNRPATGISVRRLLFAVVRFADAVSLFSILEFCLSYTVVRFYALSFAV